MKFDIFTISFIVGLVFITQTISIFIQYKENRIHKGLGYWLLAGILKAVGFILLLFIYDRPRWMLSILGNPLIVLGLIFLYFGIAEFYGEKVNKKFWVTLFVIFCISYLYFIFVNKSATMRAALISGIQAFISLSIYYKIIKRDKIDSISKNFTATIFMIYGLINFIRIFLSFIYVPTQILWKESSLYMQFLFIVPIIASNLWTFGFIIMLNQSLNEKLQIEKEKINRLAEELKIEKDIAQKNSITDSLTDLFNRRYFDEIMLEEFYRLKRSKGFLSLIMLDIDFFKKFNDAHGHLAGDNCLKQLGIIFKSLIQRHPDVIARYGGEEFIIVLPETELLGATILAEKIRKSVEQMDYRALNLPTTVTVSLGVVSVKPLDYSKAEEIIEMADKAMYQAKTNGRNRIEIYNSSSI